MVRILIADDQEIIRSAIARLIRKSGEDWEICGAVDNGQAAIEQAACLKPDLVILDFRMPELDGISAGRALREILPNTPILIYTWLDASAIEGAVREAGLQAVVQKSDGGAILWAIRDVLAGKDVFESQSSPGEATIKEMPVSAISDNEHAARLRPEKEIPMRGRKRSPRGPRGTA